MVVVEVRQGTLGMDTRRWGPAGNTGRGWSWLRSGSDGRGWGPAENTVDRGSQLDEDDEDDEDNEDDEDGEDDKDDKEDEEDEEERRRRRTRQEEATDIKSNNPHLAGGEQYTQIRNV